MFKKITVLGMLFISTIMLAACDSSNVFEYIIDSSYDGWITLGTSADYPPYEWPMNVEGKQTIVGIDIEIAKEIAKAAKKNLKVINKGFDFLLEDLVSGKVDFVISAMTPTEERAQIVDFSKNYYAASQSILIKSSNAELYTTFESLNVNTVKIGAQLGSIQADLAEEFENAQKQFIQAIPDLVMRLQDGQINALILETAVADSYIRNQAGLMIAPIAIGDSEDGTAVAVQKGNQELLTLINSVIDELIESGRMDEIVAAMVLLNS
ncbi:transporter substrate-binding domain-containing protein [Acholeplasma equirhinis]|uniref:transporter substrate-binding domain-containing protein n=1 Tax=Acholeplasma equirhinis TaxID=555393 RepID=UPI00197A804C|nr:transporter substrate-binding domain-containing protein [Acholeplasma equirhinis]MBN3491006.1 transporter substrate-binding domain-containing protein [Acholeplasma equirhinis]